MNDIPEWRDVRKENAKEALWECDDPQQTLYAVACALKAGFDLPPFDLWVHGLPECGLKREMCERRQKAITALMTNNTDAAFRHLEWMLNRQREDMREQALLPLAITGDKATKQRVHAGFVSAEQNAEEKQPEWDKWQAEAERIYEMNRNLSKSAICEKVGEKFGFSGRGIANHVTGVGKPRKSKSKK